MKHTHVKKCWLLRCGDRHGFTLLEILVALSLISIALVVVMQLFSANLRALSVSESYVNAAAHAETIMRSVLEDENFPKITPAGVTDDGYRYETAITKPYEERTFTLNVDLFQVVVTVYWNDGSRRRSLTLQTLKMTEKQL